VYNSPEEYTNIWMDNHMFMVETQLLEPRMSKAFVNFYVKILSHSSINKTPFIAFMVYNLSG
jgi:hypothetical protein